MKILTMLLNNLLHGAQTLKFPARPPVGKGFRGLVHFEPELCNGCAQCKFRCTSRAITFTPGKGEFKWSYDPGQCTFCGRCVEGCKTKALSQDQECPPIYTTLGELKNVYTVARKAPVRKAAPVAAAAPAAATPAAPVASPVPATPAATPAPAETAVTPAAGGTQ